MMPLRLAMPASVTNPTSEATDSVPPDRSTAITPPMKAMGYRKSFAVGAVAGSSCLGMLIPPSVLMIVWGILTEQSIGALFLAGVLPGILLTGGFIGYILLVAILRPEVVGEKKRLRPGDVKADALEETLPEVAARSSSTVVVSFVMVGILRRLCLGRRARGLRVLLSH